MCSYYFVNLSTSTVKQILFLKYELWYNYEEACRLYYIPMMFSISCINECTNTEN